MKNRLEDFYMTPYRERSNKKKVVIIISLLSIALVVGACLAWYYGKNKNEKTLKIPENNVLSYVCSEVPDELKYDCYPDAPVDEAECINRGCCYSSRENSLHKASFPPLNVPYCYYPSDYKGYIVEDVVETSKRIIIKLRRILKSGFPKDVSNINVLISYIDDNSLRIKVCYIVIIYLL